MTNPKSCKTLAEDKIRTIELSAERLLTLEWRDPLPV